MKQTASQLETAGREMYDLIVQLFGFHRSITGDGVRRTLAALQRKIPLEVYEVPTGTKVFDWQVPQEWNIRDAYIEDQQGKRVVDYRKSNLHVVSYSRPVDATMTWRELRDHVHTLAEHPDWIPYRTSHFQDTWGFCLSQRQFEELQQRPDQRYRVRIDATLQDGLLTYGELLLAGETDREVLVSCHVCHPSLANDNLSGVAVATQLAKYLSKGQRRYSYRFIFIPATIGAITWLSLNQAATANIDHGLILSVVGDAGCSTYKRSRQGDAEIDRAVQHVLQHCGTDYTVSDFEPLGYDQRQFCSPGFNLPVGCLMRTPNGQYPEYHTSADNLDLVRPEYLADTWSKCTAVFDVLENNRTYFNRNPMCEPQLGRRGLYRAFGDKRQQQLLQEAVLWVLNLSDGRHSLLDVAERSKLSFSLIKTAAEALLQHRLLDDRGPIGPSGAALSAVAMPASCLHPN